MAQIVSCKLCHDLQRTDDPSLVRLAVDFTPSQLKLSVSLTGCLFCSLILESIQRFEGSSWSFDEAVTRVYVYGLCEANHNETLSLEIYFQDDRPKLTLELFSRRM